MTLKELAKALGLSPTTVSRALNGFPEVSEETRKKVRAAAEAYGYRPNMRARSLATGRAMAIGHVIPIQSGHEMVNPVFADFISGAGEIYSQAGYDMLISIVPDDRQQQAYQDFRTKGSVDGIIVHAPRAGDRRIHLLNEVGIPFVVHGRASDTHEDYSWVDMNNLRAFERATKLLLDLGHRRIALINGLEDMDFAIRRRAGVRAALETQGIALDDRLCFTGEMTEQYGHAAMTKLLALPDPPTAVLTSSMIPGIGIRRAIRESGREIGRDVSVIIHDDDLSYLPNGRDDPLFTATRSSVREAGRAAATMLLDIIATGDFTPRHVLLEADLILGRSTGPVQALTPT
ncbi:LacI family DNA-binding transcriptional regulator [Maritimibacter sp. DP1N21-5]|uniref:LacI family DNA-binding transcriptional regulator n=1 Tax=Maritimibacter sp. DP1N21-5 TaxID=2836867 RepID=UPI001C45E11D|nr:substrate-binding domain-containing protein [Maritimibacter sp. DP1N21-5]MBV7409860.1 substrate-binding domain-containing protein [Maritimibacter sp. DP1N21-5]